MPGTDAVARTFAGAGAVTARGRLPSASLPWPGEAAPPAGTAPWAGVVGGWSWPSDVIGWRLLYLSSSRHTAARARMGRLLPGMRQ